ncbi:PEP-CTERM sorting domain-containing protein [bacterium]|nr:MAG: PEP-CTERM sorting domain-containing protein [bacterium]
MTIRFICRSATLFFVLAASGAAQAGYGVSAYVASLGGGTWKTDYSGDLQNKPSASAHALIDGPFSGSAYSLGEGWATATPGTLHAKARGASTTNASNASSVGNSEATASFTDTITVASGSLAVGTPVTLTFSQGVSGLISGTDAYRANVYSTFRLNGNAAYQSEYFKWEYTYRFSNEAPSGTTDGGPIVLNTSVGSTVSIMGYLKVGAYTGNGWYSGGSLTVDYGHTAHYYAKSDVEGVSLLGESGHDYAAPVPEPASLAAVVLGGLGLVARRRRS